MSLIKRRFLVNVISFKFSKNSLKYDVKSLSSVTQLEGLNLKKYVDLKFAESSRRTRLIVSSID